MVQSLLRSGFVLGLLSAAAFCRAQEADIAETPPKPLLYSVRISDPAYRRYDVALTCARSAGEVSRFQIPVWTPGYYQILPFFRGIEVLSAEDENGQPLEIRHPDETSWEVAPTQNKGTVTLRYQVEGNDKGGGFFATMLNRQSGFINGASFFLYPVNALAVPVKLQFELPKKWRIATGLEPEEKAEETTENKKEEDKAPKSAFQAKDYEELVDCPIQLGKFQEFAFKVADVPFRVVVAGSQNLVPAKATRSLTAIVKEAGAIFGGFPFKHYTFFYHGGGEGFLGGLEHRNSTVIHLAQRTMEAGDDTFLSISAHEFFHAWNVKHLRPRGLGPFDYMQEVRTPSLWFAEGVTDYYAQLLLVRAGLRSQEWFLKEMSNRIDELNGNAARKEVSLEEASRKAWEGASMGFGGLSYYLKGSLMGFYFDVRLRGLSGGQRTLDDVMRAMNGEFGGKAQGYPEDAIFATLNKVGNFDFKDEYARYIRGTAEINWYTALEAAGIRLTLETNARSEFKAVLLPLGKDEELFQGLFRRGGSERDEQASGMK